MTQLEFDALKGLHPGFFLENILERRQVDKNSLAYSIHEDPKSLQDILKGNSNISLAVALKIEDALQLEEGILGSLQLFYEIKQIKQAQQIDSKPDISKFRKILFWDTKFESINWQTQKAAIIRRVFERGNEEEKNEVARFYGMDIINQVLLK
ncbi:plasmid maintenance system antidote protein VapI [Chitinophaga skermanii]|uniref:Plasmid maintenance system antidote protein VapI n=1 Tax=Chitinophaga skermanii TaxID=331697 RepID=A0A327QCK3_9BACT|nr:plasmid maintenance system antidote protein [Chitinophaga skermanii]RAJ01598.1 plasmid maintenance system antidote protein VapI [Chitinophaga skermanii]